MSKFTLERKLAAPVTCTDCNWTGKTGSLVSQGSEPAGTMRCPMCYGARIVWIESPAPSAIQ